MIFSNVEESNLMFKSGPFGLQSNLEQELNSKAEQNFEGLYKANTFKNSQHCDVLQNRPTKFSKFSRAN